MQRHCRICMVATGLTTVTNAVLYVSELGHTELVEVQLSILVCLRNWVTSKPKVIGLLAKVPPAMAMFSLIDTPKLNKSAISPLKTHLFLPGTVFFLAMKGTFPKRVGGGKEENSNCTVSVCLDEVTAVATGWGYVGHCALFCWLGADAVLCRI